MEKPDPLHNLLSAERAGVQGLGAVLAAADVTAVQEHHLGLGRRSGRRRGQAGRLPVSKKENGGWWWGWRKTGASVHGKGAARGKIK